jgi:death on curing protein
VGGRAEATGEVAMQLPYADVIDAERIVALHALGLQTAETVGTAPDIDCVLGALGNAWTAEEYRREESHASPGLLFACYLLSYLAKDHCATDGNKRMAWLAFVEVLAFYDLEVRAEDDEIEPLCSKIITDSLGGEDVADWVVDKLIEIQSFGSAGP